LKKKKKEEEEKQEEEEMPRLGMTLSLDELGMVEIVKASIAVGEDDELPLEKISDMSKDFILH
jgi:hypothetical protein